MKEPPPHLRPILQAAAQLSQADVLELIAYLEQQAQQKMLPSYEAVSWLEMEGIAPNLTGGQDAQAWVSQSRSRERL